MNANLWPIDKHEVGQSAPNTPDGRLHPDAQRYLNERGARVGRSVIGQLFRSAVGM